MYTVTYRGMSGKTKTLRTDTLPKHIREKMERGRVVSIEQIPGVTVNMYDQMVDLARILVASGLYTQTEALQKAMGLLKP